MQAKRRRGAILMGACLAAFVACYALALFYTQDNTLTRIGSILSVFVCGFWLVHIVVQRVRAVPDPETDSVRFYRAELVRLRDSQRGMVWRFVLLAPPFILWDIGFAQIIAKASPLLAWFLWFDGAFLVAILGVVAPLKFHRKARKVQSRIDAVDAAIRGNEL